MIKMTEYARRRKDLMRDIGPNGIAIVQAAPEVVRNNDAEYPYRQDSDFYYLTGFNEPQSVLVIAPKRKAGEFILFNRVRDPASEVWTGIRAGQQGACKQYQADQAFPIDDFEKILPELLADRGTVYFPVGKDRAFDQVIMNAVNQLRRMVRKGVEAPLEFVDLCAYVHEMRVVKSRDEIAVIKKAVDISVGAHIRAMQACKPGMYEYQLEAELMHEFIRHGARYPAYTPIVGAGANGCILHYISNNAKIRDGDLVLIDAGAEYENYAADITRTFPANGSFTGEQSAIYELVLESQLAALKTVKAGALWTKAQETIIKILTQGLVDLGILKGRVDSLIEKKAYLPFYMHNSGHWLGLDVHDRGPYRENGDWRKLQAGMVLTIEPGLYISADIPGVHKRWHNIGVRIEDDVVVTAKGCDVLSQGVPKTIDDVEALMAG